MGIAIITVAGISSRFNEGRKENVLKGIYSTGNPRKTLLYSILKKCAGCDRVILVGGYQYKHLEEYIDTYRREFPFEIEMVYNPFYETYGSGYSLWKGLERCFAEGGLSDIMLIEGDLIFDKKSFERIKNSKLSCVTYNYQPIYSNKAVVAYINEKQQIKYVFNTAHGLLRITEPFSMLMNSGQIWKFAEPDRVERLMREMAAEEWQGTNLVFVEKYFEGVSEGKREMVALERWENCNTRYDYIKNWGRL